jgi:hypothetical protein
MLGLALGPGHGLGLGPGPGLGLGPGPGLGLGPGPGPGPPVVGVPSTRCLRSVGHTFLGVVRCSWRGPTSVA